MSGFSDYSAQNVLNWLTGQAAMPSRPAVWLALFTTAPIDAGSGGTEVSGGAYARVQVAGTATTNNTTANGNATLNFAATPSWIVVGMSITDTTAPSVIPANTTVLSKTGTTVVMSANATGAGVGNGDTICFSAFAPSSGSAPSTVVNTNAVITFPQATANWGTVLAWGLYDAVTSGNLLEWDYLGNFNWLPTTVSSASPGILTVKAHGYSASDPIIFSTEYGGTAPSFSQSNFTGVLLVVSPATDSFSVTNAATAVNTSSTGSGMVRKIVQQSIPINVTASFAGGAMTISAA
jgi:hypothetical protein